MIIKKISFSVLLLLAAALVLASCGGDTPTPTTDTPTLPTDTTLDPSHTTTAPPTDADILYAVIIL